MRKKKEKEENQFADLQLEENQTTVESQDLETAPTVQENVEVDDTIDSGPTVKQIKNISIGQCIKTIIVSLIALCVALVPVSFGSLGLHMTYETFPIIGDGSIVYPQASAAVGFSSLLNNPSMANLIATLLKISFLAYFIIMLANILFSLFLVIFRIQGSRIFFKIYTIIAGVAMIFIFVMSIIQIVGFAGLIINAIIPYDGIMQELERSAILTMIAMSIMSGLLISKQFKWFERLY